MQDRYIFLTKIEIGKDSIYKGTQNKYKLERNYVPVRR
jgi:hypothetical protein